MRLLPPCLSDNSLPFPSQYSTGCILGCVDIRDCLSQEEFKSEVSGDGNHIVVLLCSIQMEKVIHHMYLYAKILKN